MHVIIGVSVDSRQMVKCGPAGMRACSLGLVALGFRVRYEVRVSVRVRVCARVSDGVRVSTFYFSSHQKPAGPHFTHNLDSTSTNPEIMKKEAAWPIWHSSQEWGVGVLGGRAPRCCEICENYLPS